MENLNITSPSFFPTPHTLDDLAKYSTFTKVAHSVDHKRYYLQVEAKLSLIQRIKNLAASLFYVFKWEIAESLLRQAIQGKLEFCFSRNNNDDLQTFFEGKWLFSGSLSGEGSLSNPTIQKIVSLQLKSLFLKDHNLSSIKESSMVNLSNLRHLDISENNLRALPDAIGGLGSLQTLYINENYLQALPDAIGSLGSLQTLIIYKNQLKSIPESIGGLINLQFLSLHNNRLQAIPNSIGSLSNLKSLHISHNELLDIPGSSMGNLSNLQSLDISFNQLKVIPESIGSLSNLKSLYLRNNQLEAIPDSIGGLSNLELLSLENNRLTSIPACLYKLPTSCVVNLARNLIPQEAIKQLQTHTYKSDYQGPRFSFN